MLKLLKLITYQNEAPAEGGDGGGDPASASDAPSAPPSALATGGEAPKPLSELIPEKYRVFGGEDGSTFDVEASASKLASGYEHLAKRFGSGDVPPENAEGYTLDAEGMGEGFDAESFMKDEATKGFLKRMHAKGMTNAQVQEVIQYGLNEWAPSLMQGEKALTSDDCINSLKTDVWKSEADFKANMTAANRAYRSLPQDLQAKVNERIGNDPLFNQVMALFGKEMAEDTPPTETQTMEESATVEKLMMSDAYKNPKHPDHMKVSKQVQAYFAKRTGT